MEDEELECLLIDIDIDKEKTSRQVKKDLARKMEQEEYLKRRNTLMESLRALDEKAKDIGISPTTGLSREQARLPTDLKVLSKHVRTSVLTCPVLDAPSACSSITNQSLQPRQRKGCQGDKRVS